MQTIIVLVSFIGWKASGFDFPTLYFYIDLSFALLKVVKHLTNDKTARR